MKELLEKQILEYENEVKELLNERKEHGRTSYAGVYIDGQKDRLDIVILDLKTLVLKYRE